MARDIDVYQLVRSFAHKNNISEIEYRAFADAVQRQARLASQDEPLYRDLSINPDTVLVPRLFLIAKEKKLAVETAGNDIRLIILPERYSEVFFQEYQRIEENPDIPFPDEDSLKLIVPSEWIQSISLDTDLGVVSDKGGEARVPLYKLVFPESLKPIVLPSAYVPDKLLECAVLKVRQYLRRGANKDFIQNKLHYAFPAKDIQLKDTLGAILTKPYEAIAELRKSSNDFIFPFWAYLTSHLKKDLDKKADKTPEDLAVYQAAALCEFYANHYKGKAQRLLDVETAYKSLDQSIRKPPYNFTIEDVMAFRDTKGQPLLGKYNREELENRLKEKTTKADPTALPEILVVATGKGRRVYVAKDRAFPLFLRLVTEARADLRGRLLDQWRRVLEEFRHLPSMDDDSAYVAELEVLVESRYPLLFALIEEGLLPLIHEELVTRGEAPPDLDHLFYKGALVPIDELLELPRKTMLTDARMLLPFWYAVPFLAGLVRFFRRLGGEGRREAAAQRQAQVAALPTLPEAVPGEKAAQQGPKDRRVEFSQAAAAVARELVPSGYSLDEYLRELEGRWNTLINPSAKANLTEDVNSLVRDYLRNVLRTMRATAFNAERVRGLAATLADSPSLLKIKNHAALEQYIQLYMAKVLRRN
ncbi:MAG: hypothetical protein JNG85_04115 [Spirochaetaceae bacterium]|nr:hypothetical protein [Spirochaetaceae bacterium]